MTFQSLPKDLQAQISTIIAKCPESEPVFKSLYEYAATKGPELKRKKADSQVAPLLPVTQDQITNLQGFHIVLQLPELSVLSPLRKKLNFIIAAKDDQKKILALSKSIDDPEVEPDFILTDLSKNNVSLAVVLPVPEKRNVKYLLVMYGSNHKDAFKNEPLLIQLNFDVLNQQWLPILQQLNYPDLITYLQRQFQMCGCNLQNPFAESRDSFFVEAHKGSKEGTLYFLPNHIIFGFKKPILVYNSTDIESITYTSITRITFNVTLVLTNGEKSELSMIDQSEYDKINNYVQTKEFRDRSMAEEYKLQTKIKNNESEGILEQVVGQGDLADSDDEEEDANYQFGAEESDGGSDGGSGPGSEDVSEDDSADDSADDDDLGNSDDDLEEEEEEDSEIEA